MAEKLSCNDVPKRIRIRMESAATEKNSIYFLELGVWAWFFQSPAPSLQPPNSIMEEIRCPRIIRF
jgi:hypothetical protein